MTTPEPTGRVRISNPLTTASTHRERSVQQEIDEATSVGEVYMRSLVRSQLRLALAVLMILMLTVGMLPIVFVVFDSISEFRLFGVPLPWLLLGVGVYPYLFGLGWLYVRQAERAEQTFTDLVERP
ncbi:MAG TPA: hypothetical protein VFC57_00830 [Aeromicrobium sp.]|nr:hypothetical protein [Aeromicrobium sp.]